MQNSTHYLRKLAVPFLIGAVIWFMPFPHGLDPKAWHLFAIFAGTIAGIMISPLPMGAIAMIGLTIAIISNVIPLERALAGFGDKIVWLVVCAFFISRAFINTRLGERIAYFFTYLLGRRTVGLAYGMVITEFFLAPMIPSVTARGGGIIFPLANSVANNYVHNSHRKAAAYIIATCFQSNVITSAMFLTAMAANPLIQQFAGQSGITVTWGSWALGAIVPGLINLMLMPLLLVWLCPPDILVSEDAPQMAKKSLKELGPISVNEKIMALVFIMLIFLWIQGKSLFGIDAVSTAFLGLSILLLTKVLNWNDVINEHGAWQTFVWFAVLVMISEHLSKYGMTSWISEHIKYLTEGEDMIKASVVLGLLMFFLHYFFASATTHITVLYPTFLLIFLSIGVPPMLAAMSLGFISILSSGITHYSFGSAPIYFRLGFFSTKAWWKIGIVVGIFNLAVWAIVGSIWWKFLGWY
jgi:DASS family divalent anion:Na+ symporter